MWSNNQYSLRDLSQINRQVHSVDGLDHPIPCVGIVPYLYRGVTRRFTLIDACLTSQLPKLKTYIANSGFKMENIQGIILTHVNPDHIQASDEIFQRCIPG